MTTTAPATGDAPDSPTDVVAPVEETATVPDLSAEVEKWKNQARKNEERAKANAEAAKELERLKADTMSETEKLVAQARIEGRTQALQETGTKLVAAEFKAALAGRDVDTDALLEGLDHSRFLDADGEPDGSAIAAWVDRIAPVREEKPHGFPDLGQGARGGSSHTALNGDPLLRDLKSKLGIS